MCTTPTPCPLCAATCALAIAYSIHRNYGSQVTVTSPLDPSSPVVFMAHAVLSLQGILCAPAEQQLSHFWEHLLTSLKRPAVGPLMNGGAVYRKNGAGIGVQVFRHVAHPLICRANLRAVQPAALGEAFYTRSQKTTKHFAWGRCFFA